MQWIDSDFIFSFLIYGKESLHYIAPSSEETSNHQKHKKFKIIRPNYDMVQSFKEYQKELKKYVTI